MSTDHWKLEKDLCRCCHTEGSFKILSEPHHFEGEEENYCEMLRQSINVDVRAVEGPLCAVTFTICDACIFRLRDASNFKKQVLQCEQRFKDMYCKDFIRVEITNVKIEAPEPDDMMDTGGDDSDGFDYNLVKFDDPPKTEIKEEKKPKAKKPKPKMKMKSAPKKTKKVARPKKIKTEAGEPEEEGGDGEQAEKKGGKTLSKPLIKQEDEDYREDRKIAKYTCPYCTEKFMTSSRLTKHKFEDHDVDERFKCNACNAAFNTRSELTKHLNSYHMLGKKHKCPSCEYESFSFRALYKHKFKHRTVKDFHCRFCSKSFLRRSTLNLHEKIHTGDRRKVCNECGQAFVQKASLNYHMTKYHPDVHF